MQIIDYVIIALAVIGILIGLLRGFIHQLLALIGIIGVAIGTSYLFPYFQQWLSTVISSQTAAAIVALLIVVIALSTVYGIIAHYIEKPFKKVKIVKAVDKVIGMVLGVASVYAAVAVLVVLLGPQTSEKFLPTVKAILSEQMDNSVLIKSVYSNNFFGDWLLKVVASKITSLVPQ